MWLPHHMSLQQVVLGYRLPVANVTPQKIFPREIFAAVDFAAWYFH